MPITPIDQVADLQAYLRPLQALGYKNTDHLLGAYSASADELASYLRVDKTALGALIERLPHRERARPYALDESRPRKLGVRLDRIPPMRQAFALAPATAVPLPSTINLIVQMRPIKDQANRGTCVAHASTAAAEQYFHKQGQDLDFSRQFLYWDCKQNDGDPNNEGTWIAIAMPCLQNNGCCLEGTWPYNPHPIAANEGQGPSPPGASAEAANHRIPSSIQIAPTSVQDIKAHLAANQCVAFSIPVFNSWYQNDEVTLTGDIVNPIPGENSVGGHAMCMVGYEDLPVETQLGGGRFFIRNSWNGNWATSSTLGVIGYGTIPYSYIDRFGSEAYAIG